MFRIMVERCSNSQGCCDVFLGTSKAGGGAGGRMMVRFTDTEYTGTFIAYGGESEMSYGGAGTVYLDQIGYKKTLIVDNREPYDVPVSTIFTVNP